MSKSLAPVWETYVKAGAFPGRAYCLIYCVKDSNRGYRKINCCLSLPMERFSNYRCIIHVVFYFVPLVFKTKIQLAINFFGWASVKLTEIRNDLNPW